MFVLFQELEFCDLSEVSTEEKERVHSILRTECKAVKVRIYVCQTSTYFKLGIIYLKYKKKIDEAIPWLNETLGWEVWFGICKLYLSVFN